MKRTLCSMISVLFTWFFLSSDVSPQPAKGSPRNILSKVKKIGQETDLWCWAAAGQMVMGSHGVKVPQCEQAKELFGSSKCCDNPLSGVCFHGGWAEYVKWGFCAEVARGRCLKWEEIVDQIDKELPFTFTWWYPKERTAHTMVCIGYDIDNNKKSIVILDPLPVNEGSRSTIPYEEYCKGPDYEHWDDYYNIKKR
jgi:hypothetical protein